ncbi:MAG: forespore capture DNA-binding protein RefZ [Bacillus sp. (in: firmicutes)]
MITVDQGKRNTKKVIMDAAIELFYAKGFNGTSIRDIARKANINSANIAYYFKSKNGLLEYCFIDYLEQYTDILEKEVAELAFVGADECLISVMQQLMQFQAANHVAARFVTREMTLETTLNREILFTYMAKENHYFQLIIEKGLEDGAFKELDISSVILQLKGILTASVIYSHYAAELLHIQMHNPFYLEKYRKQSIQLISGFLQEQDRFTGRAPAMPMA